MAKKKYNNNFPILAKGFARQGLSDKQIAYNLGICKDTYYKYIKDFPDFSEAIKKGKEVIDFEVENALFKRAVGFEFEETQTEYIGTGKKAKLKSVKKIKKFFPPDTGAIIFWLINRQKTIWLDRKNINLRSENINVDLNVNQINTKLENLTLKELKELAFRDD